MSLRPLRPILLIILTFVALGLIADSVTPIFEAGDEQFHYPYVKNMADGHGLPLQDPEVKQAWRQEGSQPPLYYLLSALATFWIDTSDATERLALNPHAIIGVPAHGTNDNRNMIVHTAAENFPYQRTTLAVHLIRWLSLLMGVGTIFSVYLLAGRIAQSGVTALLAASFVAFNPMFVFLSAAVNNDNLVIWLATLSLLQMIRIWQDGLTTRKVVMLGVLLGLAALSKLSALGLIGVAGVMLTWQVACDVRGKWQGANRATRFNALIRRLVTCHLSLVTPILLIAGWWYTRNFLLYGDATGLNHMLAIVGTRQGTPQLLPLLTAEIEGLRLSSWGLFGGVNVLAAPWVYQWYEALTLMARVGLLVQLYRWLRFRSRQTDQQLSAFLWLVLWLLVLFALWMRWTLITPATQGRLLFPAIATIAIVLAIGVISLSSLISFFRKHQTHTVALIAIALIALALRVALFDIAPAYTPSPLVAQMPANITPEAIRFADALELVGAEFYSPSAYANEALDIGLYWKALAPMHQNYSVFVHLLDAGELIIGQRDSYPGLGLRPTTQLQVGDIVHDIYHIKIDSSAIRPSQPQIRVGVYEFATGRRLQSAHGDNPAIGTVALPAKASSDAPNPVTFNFENYFSLTGYQIDRVALPAGEAFTLTLYWHAHGPAPKDYSIFTHVLGKNDSLWGQVDRQLPMRTWQKDQTIQDVYRIQLKPDTLPDVYEIEIGAYDLNENFKRLSIWGADGQFVGDRVLLRKIRVLGK